MLSGRHRFSQDGLTYQFVCPTNSIVAQSSCLRFFFEGSAEYSAVHTEGALGHRRVGVQRVPQCTFRQNLLLPEISQIRDMMSFVYMH